MDPGIMGGELVYGYDEWVELASTQLHRLCSNHLFTTEKYEL